MVREEILAMLESYDSKLLFYNLSSICALGGVRFGR